MSWKKNKTNSKHTGSPKSKAWPYVFACVCVYIYISQIYIYTDIYLGIYLYIYVNKYLYIYRYLYIYTISILYIYTCSAPPEPPIIYVLHFSLDIFVFWWSRARVRNMPWSAICDIQWICVDNSFNVPRIYHLFTMKLSWINFQYTFSIPWICLWSTI